MLHTKEESTKICGEGRLTGKETTYAVFERRYEILETLKDGERHNVREFRERYGVAKNAVLSDMDCLSQVAPIHSYMGRAGGYEYDGAPELVIDTDIFRAFLLELKDRRLYFGEEIMQEWIRLEKMLIAWDKRNAAEI